MKNRLPIPSGWHRNGTALALALSVGAILLAPQGAKAETLVYYHLDAIGSVRAVTSSNGSLVEQHDYYAYGEECTTGPCASSPGIPTAQPLHFTGKERDKETGLDYFGARYYGSRLARLTTVDPLLAIGPSLRDPQRWNRYAYAKNNPFKYVDPDGRYTCSGKECEKFEKQRQLGLRSASPDVRRGAAAYGDAGVANGVTVTFTDPGDGHNGTMLPGLEMLKDGSMRAKADVKIRPGLAGTSLADTIAHEGSHAADAQDFVATMKSDGSYDGRLNLTDYATEFRAYMVTQSVWSAANDSRGFGDCFGTTCKLGRGVTQQQATDAINRLLANPKNGYGVVPWIPGSKLYPALP